MQPIIEIFVGMLLGAILLGVAGLVGWVGYSVRKLDQTVQSAVSILTPLVNSTELEQSSLWMKHLSGQMKENAASMSILARSLAVLTGSKDSDGESSFPPRPAASRETIYVPPAESAIYNYDESTMAARNAAVEPEEPTAEQIPSIPEA